MWNFPENSSMKIPFILRSYDLTVFELILRFSSHFMNAEVEKGYLKAITATQLLRIELIYDGCSLASAAI